MAKITLNDLTTNFGSQTLHNTNNGEIESHLNSKVLYRDNPDGEPNQMENDLDMNSNDILNCRNGSFSQISVGGKILDPDSTGVTTLPSQTGHGGKHLVTDGSNAYWSYDLPTISSVEALKAESLPSGSYVKTIQYYETPANTGDGGAIYKIVSSEEYGGTPDGYGDHLLANNNVALLQVHDTVNVNAFGAIPATSLTETAFNAAADSVDALEAARDYAANAGKAMEANGLFKVSRALELTGSNLVSPADRERLNIVGDFIVCGAGDHDVINLGHNVNVESLTVYGPNITTTNTYGCINTGTSISGFRNKFGLLRLSRAWGGSSSRAIGIKGQYFFSNTIESLLFESVFCSIKVPFDRMSVGEFNANEFGSTEIYAVKGDLGWVGNAKGCHWGQMTIQDCNDTTNGHGVFAFVGVNRGNTIDSLYLEENSVVPFLFGHPDETPNDPNTSGWGKGVIIGNLYSAFDTPTARPSVRVRRSGLVIESASIGNTSGPWLDVVEENAAGELHYYETFGGSNGSVSLFGTADSKFLDLTQETKITQVYPSPFVGSTNPAPVNGTKNPPNATFFNYFWNDDCEAIHLRVVGVEDDAGTPNAVDSYVTAEIDVGRGLIAETSRFDDSGAIIQIVYDGVQNRIQIRNDPSSTVNFNVNIYMYEYKKKVGPR